MIKQILSACVILFLNIGGYSQPARNTRFRDIIFSKITVQKNLTYSADTVSGTRKKFYLFDLYQPAGDTATKRPLIIWMHGGGFKFGSKRSKSIRMWSKSFARRGYICAAINYRLSRKNPLRNFKALVHGCYEAVEDVNAAMEFFSANHSLYSVDTAHFILAGNSAGAIVAMQAAYSDQKALARLMQSPDSGLVNATGQRHKISVIINFWGAIFDTAWLRNARVPIVSAHGRKDRVVPYRQNGSVMFGSYSIHQKADELKIPNRLKTYHRYGHELQKHFIPILRSRATKQRWLSAGQFASNFLYDQVLK